MKKSVLDWIVLVLVIIGAVNWGLVAFNINVVELILGSVPVLVQIVYILVGLAGLYTIYMAAKK
jgi:uncharacterized membrane protein YuzA (DUF378 family)